MSGVDPREKILAQAHGKAAADIRYVLRVGNCSAERNVARPCGSR